MPQKRTDIVGRCARNGVLVVDGYGLRIAVERRHLVISDGTGRRRREARFAKVGHGIRRVVILGHSGTITLEALRWLDRVGITWMQLDHDGRTLAAAGGLALDDARLRRSQALAASGPVGVQITVGLLDAKLAGQAAIAAERLDDPYAARAIEGLRDALSRAAALPDARDLEAKAAKAYFATWRHRVSVRWAARDSGRVPDHWQTFETRGSTISTTGPIHASDPVNAMLNYLYALAQTECRRACLVVGLDPGLGFLHADVRGRAALVLDLIEAVRPDVDRYLLDLLDARVFSMRDFHETDEGRCRLLPPLTHQLAETLPLWEAAIGPHAEAVAHCLADASPYRVRKATSLTSTVRRARSQEAAAPRRKKPRPAASPAQTKRSRPTRACEACGVVLQMRQRQYCTDCWPDEREARRVVATTAAAKALGSDEARRQRRQAVAKGKARAAELAIRAAGWQPEDWQRDIAPRVRGLTLAQIMSATGLAISHASRIKRGVAVPAVAHWGPLSGAATEDQQVVLRHR